MPADLDYRTVRGLSTEVQQKLNLHKPETIGQAARISGITPAAISLLLVHLKRGFGAGRRVAGADSAAHRAALGVIADDRPRRRASARCARAPAVALSPPDARAQARRRTSRCSRKWNRTYNLTAIREPERMVTHHVLDALAVLPHLPRATVVRVLDVGSGGGVPGHSARDRAAGVARRAARQQPQEGRVPAAGGDRARARQRRGGDRARRGLRARRAVRRRDLARVLRSRDVRACRARVMLAPGRPARRDEGRLSARGDRAASRRRCAWSRAPALAVPGLDAERHLDRRLEPRDDADHRGRQPEGRRRQDDDGGQPRGEPRRDEAARAARRPRSAGQRDDRRGRRQARAHGDRVPGAARRAEDRRRARRVADRRLRPRARRTASSPAPRSSSSICRSARCG